MKQLDLDRKQLKFVDRLVTTFKAFREEKNIIKAIKFKTENIKVSHSKEWESFDKVCKALILDGYEKERNELMYKKYKYLDLDNLKQIHSSFVIFKALPR